MKNNKFYVLAGFLGLVSTTLIVSTMASAYQGDPNVQSPNFNSIRHESMLEAFENNDYDAWAELHEGRGKLSEVVTVDNFDRFTTMHELMLSGDKDGAQEIREELGLGQGRMGKGGVAKGSRRGDQRGMRTGNCTYNQ